MALYDLNHGWVTTEEGALRTFADVRETVGHLIVQEVMVLANRLLAEWAVARKLLEWSGKYKVLGARDGLSGLELVMTARRALDEKGLWKRRMVLMSPGRKYLR